MPHPTLPVKNFDRLRGLIREVEGERLAWLASQVPKNEAIVEVGSYMGQSTVCLSQGSVGARVHAVDPWDLGGQRHSRRYGRSRVFRAFRQQTRRYNVQPHRGYSVDVAAAWTGPLVGLLFIDGEHTYDAVLADVNAWWGKLAPRAWVAFHDYDPARFPEVVEAVDEWTMGLDLTVVDRVAAVKLP